MLEMRETFEITSVGFLSINKALAFWTGYSLFGWSGVGSPVHRVGGLPLSYSLSPQNASGKSVALVPSSPGPSCNSQNFLILPNVL